MVAKLPCLDILVNIVVDESLAQTYGSNAGLAIATKSHNDHHIAGADRFSLLCVLNTWSPMHPPTVQS